MRKGFIIYFLIGAAFSLSAQSLSLPGESSRHCDTHLVLKGETLYSLSKKYHTTVDALLELNPGIINNNLDIGKIRVPFIKEEKVAISDRSVMHKVEKGETVYSISKKFNTDVSTILMWNDLKEPLIREGEILVVGYETPQMNLMGPFPMEDSKIDQEKENPISYPEKKEGDAGSFTGPELPNSSSLKMEKDSNLRTNPGKENHVLHDEKGIALWTPSTYDGGNFYALHATAPQGTEITVKNLMNEKTVTVKVIGRLPATSENGNVLIKLSESAAKKLNVLDEKFLVELTYSLPEEITSVNPN